MKAGSLSRVKQVSFGVRGCFFVAGSTCRCCIRCGGLPDWSPADLAAVVSAGVACLLCRLLSLPLACFVAPIPPTPFPGGAGGRPRLFHARGFVPCIPGNRPGAALAMLAGNRFFGLCRGNTCFAAVNSASGQSIIEKSSWGLGGGLHDAPNVSPVPPVPPRCTPPHAGRNCKLHKNAQNG